MKEQFPERFGPFVLLRMLGAGGMGTAYLALHPESQQLLVVKRMHPELVRENSIFKRFVHEAEVAAHVRHANVAALVAMGTIDNEPFLATEYVFGIQLCRIVDRVEESLIDPVPLGIGLHLAVELVSGLQAIHEARHLETGEPLGLIHRDVGSRNVLIGFDGRVRLIDLGLGKSILADWQTAHEVLAGSPDYMPPEQAMGARVDARADVYAAGVTIWELLAGKKRIREEGVAARLQRAIGAQPEPLLVHRPDAPPRLEAILKTAMHPDPDRRTATSAILKKTLTEEALAMARKMSRDDIIAWLDSACATVIAKEKRELEDARASAKRVLEPRQRPKTQVFVGEKSLSGGLTFFAPEPPSNPELAIRETSDGGLLARLAPSALVDPAGLRSAPARTKVAVLALGAVGLLSIATITAILVTPDPPEVQAVALPAPAPPPPPIRRIVDPPPPAGVEAPEAEDDDVIVPPPLDPVREPPLPPASPDIERRRLRLVEKVRDLRRVSFEVEWQRKLTRLSTKLTRARTDRALDEIESTLRRMENET